MPNPNRLKGDRFEREVVAFLQERGIAAERIPLSGASPFGSFSGFDLNVPLLGTDLKAECKHYGNGFKMLYNWLNHGQNDLLIIRANRSKPLAIIPLELLADLAVKPVLSQESERATSKTKPVKKKRTVRTTR